MSDPFFELLCKSVNKNWKIVDIFGNKCWNNFNSWENVIMDCYYFVRQDRFSQIKLFFVRPGLFFLQKQFYEKKQMI